MNLQEKKEYLANLGYKQTNYWLCFMPPNIAEYEDDKGNTASLEDEEGGELEINGKPLFNTDAIRIFSSILNSNRHL